MSDSRKVAIVISSAIVMAFVGLSPAVGAAVDLTPSEEPLLTINATSTPSPDDAPPPGQPTDPSDKTVVGVASDPDFDAIPDSPAPQPAPTTNALARTDGLDEPLLPLGEVDLPTGAITEQSTEAYTRLERELFLKHPEEWGGAYLDGEFLYVNTVTRSEDEASALLKELGISGAIKVRQVKTSIADFDAIMETVSEAPLGNRVAMLVPNYREGNLLVGLRTGSHKDVTAEDVARLLEQGAERGGFIPVPVQLFDGGDPQPTSRFIDTSPFSAGALIRMYDGSTAVGVCSTGFAWVKSPYNYMLTAAHCARYADGSTGSTVKVKSVLGPFYTIGTVPYASWDTGGTISGRHGDYAMVRLTSGYYGAPEVYAGSGNATATRLVKNSSSLSNGTIGTLRTSGASCESNPNSTCQTAPSKVVAVDMEVRYKDGRWSTHMTATQVTSGACAYEGDSGGAFYTERSDGGANAIGILSGRSDDYCYIYYTPLGYVADDFGGALLVD